MTSEKSILHDVLLESSKLGARLFRNNIANAWIGESVRHPDGTVTIRNARRVAFGIPGVGGSDLIGWYPIIVQPQDVGRKISVFTAVETKTLTGRMSPEQKQFIAAVIEAGGIAGCARSVVDLASLLRK